VADPRSKLPGAEVQRLHDALLAAFPTRSALAKMVRIGLDANLEAFASQENLSVAIMDLIRWVEAEERLDDLIAAARRTNPDNPALRAFAEQYKTAPPAGGTPPAPKTFRLDLTRKRAITVAGSLAALCMLLFLGRTIGLFTDARPPTRGHVRCMNCTEEEQEVADQKMIVATLRAPFENAKNNPGDRQALRDHAPNIATALEAIPDDRLSPTFQVQKYEYAGYALIMSAIAASGEDRVSFFDRARKMLEQAPGCRGARRHGRPRHAEQASAWWPGTSSPARPGRCPSRKGVRTVSRAGPARPRGGRRGGQSAPAARDRRRRG
jgi:hypothetical protein